MKRSRGNDEQEQEVVVQAEKRPHEQSPVSWTPEQIAMIERRLEIPLQEISKKAGIEILENDRWELPDDLTRRCIDWHYKDPESVGIEIDYLTIEFRGSFNSEVKKWTLNDVIFTLDFRVARIRVPLVIETNNNEPINNGIIMRCLRFFTGWPSTEIRNRALQNKCWCTWILQSEQNMTILMAIRYFEGHIGILEKSIILSSHNGKTTVVVETGGWDAVDLGAEYNTPVGIAMRNPHISVSREGHAQTTLAVGTRIGQCLRTLIEDLLLKHPDF